MANPKFEAPKINFTLNLLPFRITNLLTIISHSYLIKIVILPKLQYDHTKYHRGREMWMIVSNMSITSTCDVVWYVVDIQFQEGRGEWGSSFTSMDIEISLKAFLDSLLFQTIAQYTMHI